MPLVLGRAVHLHPLVAMFAVVVGTTAFGILGTFLAVPVAAAINVAMHEFFPAELGALPDEGFGVVGAASSEQGATVPDVAADADTGTSAS